MSSGLEGGNVTFKLMLKSFYNHSEGGQLALPLWVLIPLMARDGAWFQSCGSLFFSHFQST